MPAEKLSADVFNQKVKTKQISPDQNSSEAKPSQNSAPVQPQPTRLSEHGEHVFEHVCAAGTWRVVLSVDDAAAVRLLHAGSLGQDEAVGALATCARGRVCLCLYSLFSYFFNKRNRQLIDRAL